MRIEIPEFALVAMVGATSSGKTTFARKHFLPTEILSSDFFRGMVCDDEGSQNASADAFDLLYCAAGKRLRRMKTTVIDATNVQTTARKQILGLAKEHDVHSVAIVLNLPEQVLQERNAARPDRGFPEHVIRRHAGDLRRSLKKLRQEGFRFVYVLDSQEEIDNAQIVRTRLWNNRRQDHGPFDIIGDIHGCYDELTELLQKLGYGEDEEGLWSHPEGRKAAFLGDLCDRGPKNAAVLRLVMGMVRQGNGIAVPGNHDVKLIKYLRGKNVRQTYGLDLTVAELEAESEEFRGQVLEFLEGLVSHYVLDDGRLVISHAGLKEEYIGRGSGRVREFCLYGGTTGETDEFGLPVRIDWAADYRGRAMIVYGHIPGDRVRAINHTCCIDTGCVFGGKLSACRYPEKEIVDVDARRQYYEPARPLTPPEAVTSGVPVVSERPGICEELEKSGEFAGRLVGTVESGGEAVAGRSGNPVADGGSGLPGGPAAAGESGQLKAPEALAQDDILMIQDVQGKLYLTTELMPAILIHENHAAAALEIMSRYAVDPHWLIYLPPTMSPCETSVLEGYLEHPLEAFAYYRKSGIQTVICEKKHMGSRAVIVLCHTAETAKQRFGVDDGTRGVLYTRTGRRFFEDPEMESAVLDRLDRVLTENHFWEDFSTEWVCLDTELMPWSEKAQTLLEKQYAPVGRSGRDGLLAAVEALEQVCRRPNHRSQVTAETSGQNVDPQELLARYREKKEALEKYTKAYREYCWRVDSVEDLRIAPFHLLACEGRVFSEESHVWHMEKLKQYCGGDAVFMATDYIQVNPSDQESVRRGVDWWLELTGSGGEGMVVKPETFVARRQTDILQPAVKCRGPEYLRIIYGPEYRMPEHLERLRKRSLSRKRSLALKEFSLGLEALNRFVRREPLYRVHECVFGVLAFESEPVDPRL